MLVIDIEHTSDPESLRIVVRLLDAEVRRLQARLREQANLLAELTTSDQDEIQKRLALLDKELAAYRERAFSGGSERRPRTKDDDADGGEKKKEKRHSKKGSQRSEQKALPVEESTCELDAADLACPCCGKEMTEWVGHEDSSEVVDVIEVRYKLKKEKRRKYRCGCGHIESALGTPKLVPGGRYSVDFGIHVVVSRYQDQIPINRLAKMMERAGLVITTQTLWDQVYRVATLLEPAKARLLEVLKKEDVVLGDETRWPLLGGRSGKNLEKKHGTKNWFIWALLGRSGVVYEFQNSRSNDAGRTLLKDFKGVVVADGYVVYRSLAKECGFTLAHDWTHVRRRFIEAEATEPALAAQFVQDIGQLFLIEREIKAATKGLNDDDAQAVTLKLRQEKSRPIVEAIGRQAVQVRAQKESPIGRALTYLANRWEGLQVFLTKPEVPITSNGVERALRNPVVGRKTSLGSRSERGIKAASILYTLIQSALQHGLDPPEYLRVALNAALEGRTIPLPHEIK